VQIAGSFPDWKNIQAIQNTVGQIKNGDIIFLYQNQKNGNRKIATKMKTSVDKLCAAAKFALSWHKNSMNMKNVICSKQLLP